jgi:outer membrane protein OmpA-like peptidoglycan-associated protein
MQITKFKVLLTLTMLLCGVSFGQKSTSGYDVYDTSVVTRKGMPQQNEFWNHTYNFPSKPRDMWEVGVSGGTFNISGDVPSTIPTFGFGAHVRKSMGYVFSLRLQYIYGTAKGLNWNASSNYAKNTPWSQYYSAPTTTGTSIPGRPAEFVYYNYKTKAQDLSLQALISLNNIKFHKNKSKWVAYGGAGIGATTYETYINARNEAAGTTYSDLFTNVYNNNAYKFSNRKEIRKQLKAGMDDTYEEAAQSNGERRAKIGGQALQFSTSVIFGLEYKISKRINLALEDRHTFVKDDLMDGQQWQESPQGDAVLSPNWDSYNYLSLGLNINLGSKSVEPRWWLNPLDYVYGELNNPRHTPRPEQKFEDEDGDGVVNQLDKEPNTPAGAPVDTHGVAKDTDGDGVPDYKDKQLITPTDCQGSVDADGVGKCPDPECCKNPPPPISTCPTDYPSITFKSAGANLSNDNKTLLKFVADKMKANPECNITVTGYPKPSKAEQAACRSRVDAVKNHLVKILGITENRIIVNCELDTDNDPNVIDIKSN